jgi:hypothetical protein
VSNEFTEPPVVKKVKNPKNGAVRVEMLFKKAEFKALMVALSFRSKELEDLMDDAAEHFGKGGSYKSYHLKKDMVDGIIDSIMKNSIGIPSSKVLWKKEEVN